MTEVTQFMISIFSLVYKIKGTYIKQICINNFICF